MQIWEYKNFTTGDFALLDKKLNEIGNEGWELVAAINFEDIVNPGVRYIFKRPKQ